MLVKKLQISNLRNLRSVEIEPHPGLNILYGSNGAGKTSILESIVVLSRGRSFRTTQAAELIGPTGKSFQVFAETRGKRQTHSKFGLERSPSHWRARKNGKDLLQLSKLTKELPLVLMEPNSHLLVSGPPETRRKFLDWGMFHVEHEFLQVWKRFSKILKQRNAALRLGEVDVLDGMDAVFAEIGQKLGSLRAIHTKDLSSRVELLLEELSSELDTVAIEYKNGWRKGSLCESLQRNRDNDLAKGVTSAGPHRSDLSLLYRGIAARAVLSRGEQKILAAALLLAQADILALKDRMPVILLDDLASEFDELHYQSVLNRAMKVGGQVWVSGTRKLSPEHEHKMFHVERGEVTEMVQ